MEENQLAVDYEYGLDPDRLDQRVAQLEPYEAVGLCVQPLLYRLNVLDAAARCARSVDATDRLLAEMHRAGFAGVKDVPGALASVLHSPNAEDKHLRWQEVVVKFVCRHLIPLLGRDLERLDGTLGSDGIRKLLSETRRKGLSATPKTGGVSPHRIANF